MRMGVAELARRCFAYVAGWGATAAVLSPLLSDSADSFPISTYPMFARSPGQPTLYAMLATSGDGTERTLTPELVGSTEVLQAKVMIQRSVQRGQVAMSELCQATAARVAASGGEEGLSFVEIVRRRYDPIAYFVSRAAPLEQERIFRCPVPRVGFARPGRASKTAP